MADATFISGSLLSIRTLRRRQPRGRQRRLEMHTHHPREAHGTSSKRTQRQLQPASLALPNNPSISLEEERGGGWKGGCWEK